MLFFLQDWGGGLEADNYIKQVSNPEAEICSGILLHDNAEGLTMVTILAAGGPSGER